MKQVTMKELREKAMTDMCVCCNRTSSTLQPARVKVKRTSMSGEETVFSLLGMVCEDERSGRPACYGKVTSVIRKAIKIQLVALRNGKLIFEEV